ncbi:type VII secretion protein EccB [Streptomyces sp. NPDC094143]|uniref:type VII secretion protein EccB n=1 Tax=Streptomyces sp. NPDC094143 TaxID=3155310 RepID=UPI00333498DC
MQNKRDQVQAHMFVVGRLTSSMLRADPDAPESPQGRTNRGTAVGVLIAIIICAGAFVLGLIKPGAKTTWRTPGTLVVNKDTGSRYLYLEGRLHPVRNYASARLLVGADMKTTAVGSASLRGVPHGPPVGLPGAPDALPSAGELAAGPWHVCSRPANGTGTTAARQDATTTLAVGTDTAGRVLGDDEALLVTGPDRTTQYLVWQGNRLRLDRATNVAEALGYGSTVPLQISASFLSALQAGPDLEPVPVPGRGKPGPQLGGHPTKVGQVFRVTVPGSAPQMHLLRQDGLVPLTDTAAALLLGDPATRTSAYGGGTTVVRQIGADALTGNLAAGTDGAVLGTGLPPSPPKLAEVAGQWVPCVRIQPGRDGTRMRVTLAEDGSLGPVAQPPREGLVPACLPVDRITVPAGGGALVHVLGAGGADVGSTAYLVTDTGMKYRVRDAEAMQALGYAGAEPRPLPALLLAMLPTGPDLSTQAALSGKGGSSAPRCAERGAPGTE